MNDSFRALLWVKWTTTKHKLSDLKRIRFARTIQFLIYAGITILLAGFGIAGFAAGIGVSEVALGHSEEGAISGTLFMLGLDVVLFYFLMVWLGDLIAEIKRAEPIDFRKMLYLPISLRTVFLLNFGLALISPMFVGFIVPLVTFTVATTWRLGPHMLLCLPIGFMYYIMLASWTYYVQGILAYIMENKRTRQKVLVLVPVLFIVPYFFMNAAFLPDTAKENFFVSTELYVPHDNQEWEVSQEVLGLALGVESKDAREQQRDAYWTFVMISANSVIPLGWMPLGLAQVIEGRLLLALQSFLGLAALSGLALLLGYRSTLRFYTTPPTSRSRANNHRGPSVGRALGHRLVDIKLPVLESRTSALAINSYLTTLRHPSVWAQLIAPLFFMWLLYMAYVNIEHIDSTLLRGLITNLSSTMVIMLPFFGTITVFTNMFGLDVGGFRAYVLLPVPRWKYLLGFNIVVFSIPAFFAVVLLCFASMLIPYSVGEFFISVLQIIQIGLTLCIVGNVISILCPYHLDMHNFRPSLKQQFTLMLAAFLVMGTLGLLSIPVAFSLLIDSFLVTFLGYEGISIGTLTSIAMIILVAVAYWATLPAMGGFLQ